MMTACPAHPHGEMASVYRTGMITTGSEGSLQALDPALPKGSGWVSQALDQPVLENAVLAIF